jgi:hypothetical protein
MLMRIAVLATFGSALVACGPGAKIASGKQAAAEALYAASGATKGGADRLSQPLLTTDLSVTCQLGGTAKLSGFQAVADTGLGSGGALTVGQAFTVTFDHCAAANTESGKAELNGSADVTQSVVVGTGTADVLQKIKGHILYQGAMDDFLDADVTQQISAAALSQANGGVSLTLNGSLADSSGSYQFADAVNVTAGSISVQVSSK